EEVVESVGAKVVLEGGDGPVGDQGQRIAAALELAHQLAGAGDQIGAQRDFTVGLDLGALVDERVAAVEEDGADAATGHLAASATWAEATWAATSPWSQLIISTPQSSMARKAAGSFSL